MEIIRLPEGEIAPKDSDCVAIDRLADGSFKLNAAALAQCGDGEEAESVALIGGETYASYDEAESAGLAWVADHCVGTVYVSREAHPED